MSRACASSSNTSASRASGALPTSTDGWRSSFTRRSSAVACSAASQTCRLSAHLTSHSGVGGIASTEIACSRRYAYASRHSRSADSATEKPGRAASA